ncbi:MAG: tetratricopeptide repeat protein [Planctomycetes bacterium]|nr:tetratricopeptide repeat protein [Planctomycetota bacterium]
MPRRYFNWKLAIILLIGLVVLAITASWMRRWQRSRRADQGLVLGNQAYDECNWKEATENLGRYISVVQDDVSVLLKYAQAQLNIRPLKRHNVQQAIAAYRAILRIDKSDSKAALMLVEIYLQMGMSGEAELIASRVLETNQSPKLRRMLAIALINQRKFKDAVKELKNIIKEHPEQILAYDVLGLLTEHRGEDFAQPSQFWFDEAVRNNPSSPQAYIIRGAYYLRRGDKAKNLIDLEQAEQQDLSEPAVRLRLAGEFINANVLDKARKHLEVVQSVEPKNLLLWETWARFVLKSGSKKEMARIAMTGLNELSSQPLDFMPIAAELYIRCDELDRANDCISKLHQNDILPATTAFLEGFVADKRGHSYEAIKCWYEAIQLGSKAGRVRLALAAALSRSGDKQSAIKQLRALVSEQPNLVSGRLNLARLLTETGSWAEGAEQARLVMQISPDSLDAVLLYTKAQMQLLAENLRDKTPSMQRPIPHEVEGVWGIRDIKERLAVLEEKSDNTLPVKILQLQLTLFQSQFDKAEQLLSSLRADFPSEMEVDMAEVKLLIAQDKISEAQQKLEIITETFSQALEPVNYLAILLAAGDRRQDCENVINDAIARFEQPIADRQLGLLLADFYNRWGEQEKCFQLLSGLNRELAVDIPVKRRLLRSEIVYNDTEFAQRLIDEIKTIEGQVGWQWRYEQARIWFGQDDFKDKYPQIISLLKENLLANPDDMVSRMLLATAYERAGELQFAISTYNEALNYSPRDIRIIVPAVAALYKAKEYDRADEILRQVANERMFHPDIKKLELHSHLRRGELASASDILSDFYIRDPNNQSVGLSLALLKMRQNKFVEADEMLSKLKDQNPDLLPIIAAQIVSKVRQDKPDEALLLSDEVVSKFNNASAYIIRAKTFAFLGQAEKAEKDLEHAVVIEPNNAEPWIAKSDFYRSAGQLDKALADIQKAMFLSPETTTIEKRAISLLLASSDPNVVRQGKNVLDKVLTVNPDDIGLRLYKARWLLAQRTATAIEEATGILQKITNERPKLSDAWALLAETALAQAQPLKAIDIVLRGLVYRPDDKSLLLLKARSEAAKSPVLAIPTIKALRELYPNDIDVVLYMANTYLAADQSQKAVELLRTQLVACSGTGNERKIRTGLAAALYKNGSKVEAQQQFHSLYQSAPDDTSPLLAQAQLLQDDQLWSQLNEIVLHWCRNHPEDYHTPIMIAGDLAVANHSEAKKTSENILRMVLENNSDSTEAVSALAMLLQITGRFTESAALYQQTLELQPDNVIAINNLAWILCKEQGECQQALELVCRGLEIAPEYIDLIDTRGVAYYQLGEFERAAHDFTRCLKLYPNGTPSATVSHLHLGKSLAKLGQNGEAAENIEKALELNTKIGGLSAAESTEAQLLLKELSKGI